MNVNNQAVRIWQQECRVFRDIIHVQDHTRQVYFVLRHTNFVQEARIHIKGFASQTRREFHAMQVKEDAVRIGNASRLIFHLLLQINGYAGVIGRGPVADIREQRR